MAEAAAIDIELAGTTVVRKGMTLAPESLALRYGRQTQLNLRLKARALGHYPVTLT